MECQRTPNADDEVEFIGIIWPGLPETVRKFAGEDDDVSRQRDTMKPADLRTVIAFAALSLMLANYEPLPVSHPNNDFVLYYDVAGGVDRSPYRYPEGYGAWVYTPAAKTFFQVLFSYLPHHRDAQRVWYGVNMFALMAVLLAVSRWGWVETALVVAVIRQGFALWACGNIAPILVALSLTPLGAVISCGFKPYFLLFALVHFVNKPRRLRTWVGLAAASLLAVYSVLGLTNDQRTWLLQNRLFDWDYYYWIGVLLALFVSRYGKGLAALLPLPLFRKWGAGPDKPPKKISTS
jgi:hypothetical protein